MAANAQIGVARAAYFPQISLTGTAGYESPALTSLFTGPAGVWNMAASLTQPIFEGGRLKSNVRLAEAQREQMVLTYQQTIQGAFRDVSNALVAYRKDQEFTSSAAALVRIGAGCGAVIAGAFQSGDGRLPGGADERNQFASRLSWDWRRRKATNSLLWSSSIRLWAEGGNND